MTFDEDKQVLAAEYVLGTLDADERERVEDMLDEGSDFAMLLHGWERRLGSLAALVASIEPQPSLWDKISDAVATIESQRATAARGGDPGARAPDTQQPEPQTPAAASIPAASGERAPDAARSVEVVALTDRLRRTRALAGMAGAIAAVLLVFVGLRTFEPEYLPQQWRPERAAQAMPYVAMLQKDGGEPAFMLAADPGRHRLSVRRIGAAPRQGKSYQLWLVSSAYPAPRSLGVLGADSQDMSLAPYNKDAIESATYAVSLEPLGGSPTGAPTGPVMYSGKLVAQRL